MIKTVIVALTATLVAAASPAVADVVRNPAEPAPSTARGTAPAQPEKAATVSPKQRYCISDTITGSRLPYKVCQTRDQWLDQGIDPLAKK